MRQIGTLSNELQARNVSDYLKSKGIANSIDMGFEPIHSRMSYQIWIHDEDKIDEACRILNEFRKNPTDLKFESAREELVPQDDEKPKSPSYFFRTYLTVLFLSLCGFLFFLNTIEEVPVQKEGVTPLQEAMMYDLPEKGPSWQGMYDWIVYKLKGEETTPITGPLFVKIRQGEIWRLFTPCLLHASILHILFNMLWLWYLGRPIEQRIGPLRYLILTLVVGMGSNTIQYLMSGPIFVGYSGVVTGLAGFTWMREQMAPWEGYPLTRSIILFLFLFIVAIFLLSLTTFFIQVFTTYHFDANIANTAHIAGAVIGALLGRFRFFAQRVRR